jgi:hypothetical protein
LDEVGIKMPDNRLRQRLIDSRINHARSGSKQIAVRRLQSGQLNGGSLFGSAHRPRFGFQTVLKDITGRNGHMSLKRMAVVGCFEKRSEGFSWHEDVLCDLCGEGAAIQPVDLELLRRSNFHERGFRARPLYNLPK